MPALITWWRRDLAAVAPKAADGPVHDVGADLLRRWGEPQRRYHTTQHLVEVFWALEEVEEAGELTARDGSLGRVAAWFHDAVYVVPDAAGNESASAALAASALRLLHVDPVDAAEVDRLVRASERHELPSPGGVDAAFHDADLWILAAPRERFDEYCAQVREEYAAVPADAFAAGRASVLRPFLTRTRLYATAYGHERWTEPARANLARELARLR